MCKEFHVDSNFDRDFVYFFFRWYVFNDERILSLKARSNETDPHDSHGHPMGV